MQAAHAVAASKNPLLYHRLGIKNVSAIDPANQLAALIRVQVASLRDQRLARGGSVARSTTSTQTTPDVSAIVAKRIRAVSSDDPQRKRKALRVFLETVILSELGHELANDPAFPLMLDHVQLQMESEPELARVVDEAAGYLLVAADRS